MSWPDAVVFSVGMLCATTVWSFHMFGKAFGAMVVGSTSTESDNGEDGEG